MGCGRTRTGMVIWDRGCTRLVMGFEGGCVAHVNNSWTWEGNAWTVHQTRSSPTAAGQGAMLFDSRLGQVVYVNGAGHAWAWDGSGWGQLALPSGPSIPIPGSRTQLFTLVAGYNECPHHFAF